MRDKLDDLRFRIYELTYSVSTYLGNISDRTKYITLSFFIVSWIAICTSLFIESYRYEAEEVEDLTYQLGDYTKETIEKAEELQEQGLDAEAFNLLATHYNHFGKKYSETQLEKIELKLSSLAEEAIEIEIPELYKVKDLAEQQPIYKFLGIVNAVDNDPLYGVTYTISKDGDRTNEQLEVSGLTDMTVGTQIEFYGVPKFESVSSPIKVEAFVVPIN